MEAEMIDRAFLEDVKKRDNEMLKREQFETTSRR
jgi:hypothetical protein